MAKPPNAQFKNEDFEAPTVKRVVPAELRESGAPPNYVTTKLRKAEIEALLKKEREKSGMQRAITDEEIERFDRREARETLPAPPEPTAEAERVRFAAVPGKPPPLPEEIADLDADEKRR